MTTLSLAIHEKRWEMAAVCLLLGVTEAAAALPPDAVEGLLEVLAGLEVEDAPRQAGARSSARLRTGRGRRR